MRQIGISFSRFLAVAVFVAASVFYVSGQESGGILLNKSPLRDFGDQIKLDVDSKKVDLSGPFLVEFRGRLDETGKLDPRSSAFIRTEGDSALVEIVKQGILAISDTGFFQYFKSLDAKEFVLLVEQTPSAFQARIAMEHVTENRSKSICSALNVSLELVKARKQGLGATDTDKQYLFLLEGMKVQNEGRGVVISFRAPAVEVQKLVAEKLAEHWKNGQ